MAKIVRTRLAACAFALLLPVASAQAKPHEVILHAFTGGTDGGLPNGLIADAQGNLYGTTHIGGTGACRDGCGFIFKMGPDGTQTVLHNFADSDGSIPSGPLLADSEGDLFGTATEGGSHANGVVFKLAADGTFSVLYNFCSLAQCSDGALPSGPLIADSSGNLYGTTTAGPFGGTVFKLAPDGRETVLYAFCRQSNCSDGSEPVTGVVADSAGNLYGTTFSGGANDYGAVFKLASDGTETVLHSFCQPKSCEDGANPSSGVIMDSGGNLYGSTLLGGTGSDNCGVVYKIAADGTETILHDFSGTDGCTPAGLAFDGNGNILGVTSSGGSGAKCPSEGCGTVFKLAPGGTETVLLNFWKTSLGRMPVDPLTRDPSGNWYGTTLIGGDIKACKQADRRDKHGCGVVFRLARP